MFAPLKRIAILATALLFPGVAFSYVTINDLNVDNFVPTDSEGFVVGIEATASDSDGWGSTYFSFSGTYSGFCLDHDDYPAGDHQAVFYVEFDGQTASSDATVYAYGYTDDSCSSGNNNSDSGPIVVEDFDGEEGDVVQFVVNKVFRPASDMDIQVNINCSAGSPGDDSAIMGGDGLHIFPQEFLNPANPNHDCVITEADVPAGYQALYITNPAPDAPNGAGGLIQSFEGCFFYGSGNMRYGNACQIVNAGLPATFTITKFWEVFQDDDANFVDVNELRVRLTAHCTRPINGAHVSDQGLCLDIDSDSDYNGCDFFGGNGGIFDAQIATFIVTGDAEMTLSVDNTGYEPVVCYADEDVFYSNVEQTHTDCSTYENGKTYFEIGPGGSAGCTYVNTVFFEGIPTLSQYGMAIMALLMLGVGFVGFRRFV